MKKEVKFVVAVLLGCGLFTHPAVATNKAKNQIAVCKKDSLVLQHRFRSVSAVEINSLQKVLHLSHRAGRAVTGQYAVRSAGAGSDTLCDAHENSCAKLYRKAKVEGFTTFRRAKAFACSADYRVTTSVKPQSWKRPTNDSLIKNQRYALNSLDLAKAWKISTGDSSVVVAVIDTGVDYTHPDLAPNMLPGKNYSLGQTTDDPFDDNGHGTHVAGTIGAVGNNGAGVAGMSWNSAILPLKFLDTNGSGYLSDAVRAINYMIYAKTELGLNIRISNNSWGGGAYSDALYAAISLANDYEILFIAAAGNEANDNDEYPSYPADYDLPNVVSVAAYDSDLMLAYFSNYGSKGVDIAAPGVRIASTYPGGSYAYLSGTSMATPHVSGALALLASTTPSLTSAEIKTRLYKTARYNSELNGYIKDGAQLNVLNLLRNRTSQSLSGLRRSRTKAN